MWRVRDEVRERSGDNFIYGVDYRVFLFQSPISEATSTPRKDRIHDTRDTYLISVHSVRILFPRGGKPSRNSHALCTRYARIAAILIPQLARALGPYPSPSVGVTLLARRDK